jgi:hypothetical protein
VENFEKTPSIFLKNLCEILKKLSNIFFKALCDFFKKNFKHVFQGTL